MKCSHVDVIYETHNSISVDLIGNYALEQNGNRYVYKFADLSITTLSYTIISSTEFFEIHEMLFRN